MNKTIVAMMGCVLMLMGASNSDARLFASGGGESRTITEVRPASVYNSLEQRMSLYGNFSGHQGRDRRVVIYPDRLPTAFPVHVSHWGGHRIDITLPAHLQIGRYHVYLERNFHGHGTSQWRPISNKRAFGVSSGAHVRSDGLPHAAQIRFRGRPFNCIGQPPVQVDLLGGPFYRDRRPINNIRAEVNVPTSPAPRIRIRSNTQLTAILSLCAFMKPNAAVRLVYPDRSTSNWLGLDGSGRSFGHTPVRERRSTGSSVIQPRRAR